MKSSALQRAENSSKSAGVTNCPLRSGVSVLFSEPKIPQNGYSTTEYVHADAVSVLFSEPKIPQKPHAAHQRA